MHCRITISLRKCCSKIFRPGRIFSIGCGLKTSANPGFRVKPRSDISGQRRRTKVRYRDLRAHLSGRPRPRARAAGYGEGGSSRLVARGRRAFFEFMPIRSVPAQEGRVYRRIGYGPLLDVFLIDMRSYRDSTWNKRDDRGDTFILGSAQLAWLKRELAASNATWKVIAADLPIGLISEDAIALGDGPPERREHEIADLLSFMN